MIDIDYVELVIALHVHGKERSNILAFSLPRGEK
jgi:hypothetical protein